MLPLAASLVQQALPLARAVLALRSGLLDTAATREILAGVPAVSGLTGGLGVPQVPVTHREVWLRKLAAHVVAGTPWSGGSGVLTSSLIADAHDRLGEAAEYGRSRGRPVTYAAPSWAGVQAAQDWVHKQKLTGVMEVITLEEAVLTLGAASRTRLRRLAELEGRLLVLDGLHRLDPRGLRPVQTLIEQHAAFGLEIHLTGGQRHPLVREGTPGPGPVRRAAFSGEGEDATVEDLVRLIERAPEASTLVLLPSRKAALQVQALLPWGRLEARVKTSAHLREEQDGPGTLHISSWSPSALTFRPYERLIVTPLPLPILADACLAAETVTLLRTPVFPVASGARTGTSLTLDQLAGGAHPQDPEVMSAYWEALLPHVQQDSLSIMKSGARLEYQQIASALASLFQSGVRVLVNQPEAEQEVGVARRTGRLPIVSAHTVRMTPTSVAAGRAQGWLEEVGDALIWTGPYSADRGVGVP